MSRTATDTPTQDTTAATAAATVPARIDLTAFYRIPGAILQRPEMGVARQFLVACIEQGALVEVEPPTELPEPEPTCPICAGIGVLRPSRLLGRAVCTPCAISAERLDDHFADAVAKHTKEFHDQLPQLVKDNRSGADEPVWYRGFE